MDHQNLRLLLCASLWLAACSPDDPIASGGMGGLAGSAGNAAAGGGQGGTSGIGAPAAYPFPQNHPGEFCIYPQNYRNEDVTAAYLKWKSDLVTADGAGGFLRVRKTAGSTINVTVSEGIGYGMLLAVYMNDQDLFDNLWKYEQIHLDGHGLMNWQISPDGMTSPNGNGGATDGDEDMAWALIMADRQWGGQGTLGDTYLAHARKLIDAIWTSEVDHTRGELLLPGDGWGNVDVTNISYYAPAYYRVFGEVTGKQEDWQKVIDSNYAVIEKSLNANSGNVDNGLVPAWCDSNGTPVEAYAGAPTHFQYDSCRTPFRIGQDYCYFGEPRAKAYLAKISAFYAGVGVENIVDGYALDGTPRPQNAVNGLRSASFVGPGGVGAMSDVAYQPFVDEVYADVATLGLMAGDAYYQQSWTALSLLMMSANFVDFTAFASASAGG